MISITVISEDWERGRPRNCDQCVLSCAIRRTYPDAKDVWTDVDGVLMNGKYYPHTPQSLELVKNFDKDIWDDTRNTPKFPVSFLLNEAPRSKPHPYYNPEFNNEGVSI